MTYQVLSRKYRPQTFDALVGQAHVAQILRNALVSGRVGHAYLFVGPRGVGKTTTARIFAKALNCAACADPADGKGDGGDATGSPDPCGACTSCVDITVGSDLDVVEMDAASNNHVEDVRRLREQVGYATVRSRHRIWIVDEVHMLSLPAFNAFLKTLEEPPAGVIFLFCTTEEHKLPETFRSRCQRIEFRPIDAGEMAGRLEDLAGREGAELEEGLAAEMARAAQGGLRDAESLLEQLMAACPGGPLTRKDLDLLAGRASVAVLERLNEAVRSGDAGQALDAVDAALAGGVKPGVLVEQWLETLRAEMVAAARSGEGSLARTARALDVLLAKRVHLRAGADGALVVQVAAVELARLPDARDLDRLVEALRSSPATVPAAATGAAVVREAPPPQPAAPKVATPKAVTQKAVTQNTVTQNTATQKTATQNTVTQNTVTQKTATQNTAAQKTVSTKAPAAPAPTAAGVEAAWPELVARAEQEDGRLAQALGVSRPGQIADGYLELHLSSGHGLAKSALARRETVVTFRRLTEAVLGQALAPRLVVAAEPAAPAEAPRMPHEHPEVRRVAEATGGQLLDVQAVSPETSPEPSAETSPEPASGSSPKMQPDENEEIRP